MAVFDVGLEVRLRVRCVIDSRALTRIRKTGWILVGLFAFAMVFDRVLMLIAIYRPRRIHKATRRLLGRANRIRLWAIDCFGIDRFSESVVVYHKGRKTGVEYATPLCVSLSEDGFVVGAYWGPTTDWFRNLQTTPQARLRYRGRYHSVEAEMIDIDDALRRVGGKSTCGCWEQGRTKQCVLLRPIHETERIGVGQPSS
jgi:deazaflavin-dependent oxidoreductase (nitroreductase family)